MDTEEDDLFRCAICGTAEGDASNLSSQTSLQTNATVRCGHQFCNSCLDRELARKREFPCPICKTAVKRVNLTSRSLDHVQCEKDTSWRRRVLGVYNKAEKVRDHLPRVRPLVFVSTENSEPMGKTFCDRLNRIFQLYSSTTTI